MLEIGAADGEHTRIYADYVGPTGHVLAVEPNPQQRRALQAVSAEMPWVSVRAEAVGRMAGMVPLYTDRAQPKQSSLWLQNVPGSGIAYTVPVTTVDALVASMPRAPRLIQVDAQGAEAGILAGASRTLALPIVWVIEVWALGLQRAGASVDEVLSYFHAHTYTPHTVRGRCIAWTAAYEQATARIGLAHTDLVMVPAGAAW